MIKSMGIGDKKMHNGLLWSWKVVANNQHKWELIYRRIFLDMLAGVGTLNFSLTTTLSMYLAIRTRARDQI